MPQVKLSRPLKIEDIIGAKDKISPTEMNILIAIVSGGPMEILDLVTNVRKKNPVSYKFVPDNKFHVAIARLHRLKYVVYG